MYIVKNDNSFSKIFLNYNFIIKFLSEIRLNKFQYIKWALFTIECWYISEFNNTNLFEFEQNINL